MECQPTALEVLVNGAPRRIASGETILSLVEELGLEPARVAVELDRRIVKRAEWASRELAPGARIEIVQFVGGG